MFIHLPSISSLPTRCDRKPSYTHFSKALVPVGIRSPRIERRPRPLQVSACNALASSSQPNKHVLSPGRCKRGRGWAKREPQRDHFGSPTASPIRYETSVYVFHLDCVPSLQTRQTPLGCPATISNSYF